MPNSRPEKPHHRAGEFKASLDSVPPDDHWRLLPGVDVTQRAGSRIKHAKEDGGKHVRRAVCIGNVFVGELNRIFQSQRAG
jgi:hypothetical protein